MAESTRAARIGDQTGRMTLTVTDQDVDAYLASMDMEAGPFARPASAAPRLVPPDLVPKLAMQTLIQDYCQSVIGPNIRAKQGFRFMAPIHVGMRIDGVGRLVDVYEKRGRTFVTFEAVFQDESGRTLAVDTRTQLVTGPDFKLEK